MSGERYPREYGRDRHLRRGHLWDEPFLWDIRSGGRLYLSYENPEYGNTMCYYRYDGRYMYFSTSPTFYDYTVYATAR